MGPKVLKFQKKKSKTKIAGLETWRTKFKLTPSDIECDIVAKQGITNTLALPIDKMLYIYLLCPHSKHQKKHRRMKKGCNFWAIFSNKVLQPPWGEKRTQLSFPNMIPQKSWHVSLQNLGPICPQGIMFWAQIPWGNMVAYGIPHICLEKFWLPFSMGSC
jgi:hypothetical protein